MDRMFDIPWIEGSIFPWHVVKMPWIGVRYTMVKGLIYHGYGGQKTIDRGSTNHVRAIKIPWIEGSKYHG